MKNTRLVFAVVAILSILLTSCGGPQVSTTMNVQLTEFQFNPHEWFIPAGQEITVNAVNAGAVVHTIIIMKYGTTVGDDFDPSDKDNIYWQLSADPGQSKTLTFTAPSEAGEYQVICGTEGHFVAGMVGKLTVVAP